MTNQLSFEEFYMRSFRRTKFWYVRNKNRSTLGMVRYYVKEKKYAFFAEATGIGLDSSVLIDIASFIEIEAARHIPKSLPNETTKTS